MRMRTYVIIALALICGVSAAIGIDMVLRNARAAEAGEMVSVVVTRTDIPRYVALSESHLRMKEVPKDTLPRGVLTRIEDAVGRRGLISMSADDYVFEQQLSKKGSIASGIPLGMRAFTIKTAQVSGAISGFLQPGDKVDVLLTVQNQSSTTGGATTLTLLAKVDVLAVDQSLEPTQDTKDAKDPRSVTLLVSQAQAVKLGLGQTKGILHLTLRNGDDNLAVPETRTTLAELGFHEERPSDELKPAAPRPAPLQVVTLRGQQEGVTILQPSTALPKVVKD